MESRCAPENLRHKPIYTINDYHCIDGNYRNATDVYAISFGKAHWSDSFLPSVKIWRKRNGKWLRVSEETTITRALDMAFLVIQSIDHCCNGKDFIKSETLFGSTGTEETGLTSKLENDLITYLKNHKEDIDPHIQLLAKAIDSYLNK